MAHCLRAPALAPLPEVLRNYVETLQVPFYFLGNGYRIAVNTAKNYLESQGRRPPSTDLGVEGLETLDVADNLRDVATPERRMLANEIAETVNGTIQSLPVDLRTAITLRDIEGFSYDEIAHVMECPIGTVRSRIFRAREAIERDLKPLLET